MARWVPILRGEEFVAANRLEAELAASQRYGAKLLRCMSVPDLEEEIAEQRKRRRPPPATDG